MKYLSENTYSFTESEDTFNEDHHKHSKCQHLWRMQTIFLHLWPLSDLKDELTLDVVSGDFTCFPGLLMSKPDNSRI